LASLAVLVLYLYFNVWRRFQAGIASIHSRCAATLSLSRLPKVPKEILEKHDDMCAICLCDMTDDVRITPCRHLFHSICLRRWLYVKQVCPLCYTDLWERNAVLAPEGQPLLDEGGSVRLADTSNGSAELSIAENSSGIIDDDSPNSDDTEYTLDSSSSDEATEMNI
uniref:RING-type domain-containing protein n=1 Tax=Gongylonema pulchrum TaxID=637853 RepID=A0A183F0H4_9BILA